MDSTPVQKGIPFRLIAGSGLLLVLVVTLLNYLEEAHRVLEIQSVNQQKRVIDSSLVIVFSTYAVEGRLHELQHLDGANPFEFLEEYGLLPANYQGELESVSEQPFGWYYDSEPGEIVFFGVYLDKPARYRVQFNYIDEDGDGQFEREGDRVKSLKLVALDWQ